MKRFIFCAFLLAATLLRAFEIIDYSNEPYALIPIETAYLFKENGSLFHIFNMTELEEKFKKYQHLVYTTDTWRDNKLSLLMDKCKDYIDQLTIHRNKRGIDFLGSIFKFITGTPDHDDMILVQTKLNDLIENNNKLSVINSRLAKHIEHLTRPGENHLDLLFEWLAFELSQIIETINLAKMGILNTAVLNLNEINQIIKEEKKFDAPLLEILEQSEFKILQINSIYVLLIKYPKIEEK